ncbi:MAG TPA: 30S ribosomal protein S6, partial [Pyrinomonadaceae bacterium]|nr:30S ribosomal protein S6 [Pyrinomonadaceae bacterium]
HLDVAVVASRTLRDSASKAESGAEELRVRLAADTPPTHSAKARVYEVVFIVDPDTPDEDVTRLTENLRHVIADQGGMVTRNEVMGRRQLAYRIGRSNEGIYVLFEVEGTGREIAELERRMRVSDQVLRYLTVRVDEDRRRAEKLKERRARKSSKTFGSKKSFARAAGEKDAAAWAADDRDPEAQEA